MKSTGHLLDANVSLDSPRTKDKTYEFKIMTDHKQCQLTRVNLLYISQRFIQATQRL
jgi:hypothetical protein